jgi:hypothetical protein
MTLYSSSYRGQDQYVVVLIVEQRKMERLSFRARITLECEALTQTVARAVDPAT